MSEIIQKGWLTTRDGEKYAPNTLIENVFTRNGVKYDEHVREYLVNLQNSTTTNLTSIKQQLIECNDDINRLDSEHQSLATEFENHLKNLDVSDSNTFFIIDNDENVVAYIDADGIHAIEVEIPNIIKLSDVKPALAAIDASLISIRENISGIEKDIANIDASDRDELFIIDGLNDDPEQCNVIAYINKDGLHVTNVIIGSIEGTDATNNTYDVYETLTQLLDKDKSLSENLSNVEKNLNDEISARERAVASEKIARETIDNNLSIAVNLYTTKPSTPINGDLYIDTSGNLFIYNEINSTWESFAGLSRQLKEKTQYFDGSADDKFYLIDNNGNVIAYFTDDGLHAVNVFVGNDEYGSDRTETTYDVYSRIKQLLQDLETETSRSTGIDANHSTRIAEIETRLTNVSNVMDFVGVFASLPAAASYQKGDVCVVGEKEYVHDGSEWKLLGDVSAEMARLDALEKIVGDPATNATGTHEKRLDDLEANLAAEQTTRKDNDDTLNNYIVKVEEVVEEMNSNFNWNDPNQNTLYIIDGEERVLAQFDASGLTIIDTMIKDTSINKLKSLKTQASYMLVESSPTLSWL